MFGVGGDDSSRWNEGVRKGGRKGGRNDDELNIISFLPSTSSLTILIPVFTLTSLVKLTSNSSSPSQAKFKARSYDQSILLYSASLAVASQRMPWEASGIFKEEMSTVLCNRSAAYGAVGDVSSLGLCTKGAREEEGEETRRARVDGELTCVSFFSSGSVVFVA